MPAEVFSYLPHPEIIKAMSGSVAKVSRGKYQVSEDAAVWGVKDAQKEWGIINHSLLVRRIYIATATQLNYIHRDDPLWNKIDIQAGSNTTISEDAGKRLEREWPQYELDHAEWMIRIIKQTKMQDTDISKVARLMRVHLYGLNNYIGFEPKNWGEKLMLIADHHASQEIESLEDRHAGMWERRSTNGGNGIPMTDEELNFIIDYVNAAERELLTHHFKISSDVFVQSLKNLPETSDEKLLREILSALPSDRDEVLKEYQSIYLGIQQQAAA